MLSSRKRIVLATVAVLAVITVGGLIWVRAAYGVWWVAMDPEHFRFCDQPYTKGDGRVLTLEEAAALTPEPAPIVLEPTIGRLPLGVATPPVFSRGSSDNGCGHLVVLRVVADGYLAYWKLGGP